MLPKATSDNCNVQVFERVDKVTKNEILSVINLIGNAKSFGNGKIFRANNAENIIKAEVLPEVNNLVVVKVVETNKGDLAFGYNYTNAFANLLKNFNKYCSFEFIYNHVKRQNTRKWRLPRFTDNAECMMDNCPVVAKIQQFYLDRIELENKLTI